MHNSLHLTQLHQLHFSSTLRRMLKYLGDLLRSPLRGAPVECMTVVDEPVEGSHSFFNGRVDVWSVCEHKVNIVDVHPLQGGLQNKHK